VSVIVPFKDKPDLLRTAVESIRRLTSFPNYELVLVDNDSKDPETIRLLDELSQDPRIRVVAYPEPFNYSRANNLGVEHAAGDVLVFLNNDTQVLTPNWLDDLAGRASHPQIGAVGGLLSFADGSIQHAGVVIGMRGFASHLFAGEQPGLVPPEWLLHARDTSAVTAACLAVERSKYEEVGGFDETFQLTGNDVDLCVRLLKAGYRNVIDPWVRLFHFEKQSRATIPVPRNDQLLSFRRYQPYLSDGDPYFNSNLSLNTNRLVARTGEEGGIEQIRKQLFGGRKNAADQVGFLERYDAGAADLAANAAVMDAFARDRTGPIDRISWFIPSFDHIYRGGIYTIMRIANSFTTRAGTTNCFVVCGNDAADVDDMVEQARAAFPEMKFTLRLLRSHDRESDLEAADIGICTLWTTAYHLLKYNQCRGKFYLVQDFEPGFAPANAVYGLIEQTYRFGFCGIANTKGVGDAYRSYGNETMHFTPAVDRSVFHPAKEHATPPTRIVFYGRPKNPRNGFELGLQALTEVKTRYGDRVEITSVGAVFEEAAYGVENVLTNLGILPGIEAVADLYRASDIGLVFMFTKHPSYQPLEYMASGCATVTNVNESNAWLLKHRVNALVVPPTVGSVADAISELVEDPDLRTRVAKGGLETVGSRDWESQLDLIYGFVTEGATVE
jgi:GT2 family glycosyltransferase